MRKGVLDYNSWRLYKFVTASHLFQSNNEGKLQYDYSLTLLCEMYLVLYYV